MLSVERKLKIAEIVDKKGGIKTSDLSSMFNVSEMTILRDLSILEEEGILKRVYGGAVNMKNSTRELSVIIRKNIHPNEKNIIAEKALKFISSGESLFLDGSTTALALARKLAARDLEITVITNGLDVINELKENLSIKTICPGGELQQSTLSFIGPYPENFLKDIFADKSFISASGIAIKSGITVENPIQATVKKIMLENSFEKIILLDSSKFGVTRLSKVCQIENVSMIITDKKPPDEYLEYFKKSNVGVVYQA